MLVAQLTRHLSRQAGGLFESVRGLAKALSALDETEVIVYGLRDSFLGQDRSAWSPVRLYDYPVRGPEAWGWAPGLYEAINEAGLDILHIHDIWTFPSWCATRWYHKQQRDYIISPRGMLDPVALMISPMKKSIIRKLFVDRYLGNARYLHALNEAEAQSIRALGLKGTICVIPNGVDVPDPAGATLVPAWQTSNFDRSRVLLYLGRLHPKKNIAALLNAWNIVQKSLCPSGFREWVLVIAGWGNQEHVAGYGQLAMELDLGPALRFVGPLFGREKVATLASANAFILPSLSEGLPMAVLEAWAHRLPVIMTPACNLDGGFIAGAAVRVTTQPNSIAKGLAEMITMSDHDRTKMGLRGHALVLEKYRWDIVARQMRELYECLLESRRPSSACYEGS